MKNILEVLDQKIEEQKKEIRKWFDEYCKVQNENKQLKQENETLRNDLEQLSVSHNTKVVFSDYPIQVIEE